MKRQRIYILPTRFGVIFLIGATVIILAGSAYQNNLINMLAFFMLSLVFICMIQTHNNIKDLRIDSVELDGGFAGDEFLATTVIGNNANTPRFNLETRLRKLKAIATYDNLHALSEKGAIRLKSTYPAIRRGKHQVSKVRVSTVYPLGLFYSWRWFEVKAHYFVYPEPKGQRPFPVGTQLEETGSVSQPFGGDDFHGHRKYKDGDSHRHIDWKALARGRSRLVKEFTEGTPGIAIFDWHSLPGIPTEERLSQLTAWIEQAREQKIPFGLKLPQMTIAPGEGLQHRIRCLEVLSEYGDNGDGHGDGYGQEAKNASA